MNAAVILAGGTGERMAGLDVPKQYAPVQGKPVIMHAVAAFQECETIGTIVIVAADEWRGRISSWLDEYGVSKFASFAGPGRTRQQSVFSGLLALQEAALELVVIHDAARPLVTADDVRICVESAAGYDGATPALSVTDTVYRSANGATITELLNRDELLAGQTPECYDYAKYLAAHVRLTSDELANIRGSSEIAFKNGMKVRLFPGNPRNFKITTVADLEYFTYLRNVT